MRATWEARSGHRVLRRCCSCCCVVAAVWGRRGGGVGVACGYVGVAWYLQVRGTENCLKCVIIGMIVSFLIMRE